jgi:hypothetical protein
MDVMAHPSSMILMSMNRWMAKFCGRLLVLHVRPMISPSHFVTCHQYLCCSSCWCVAQICSVVTIVTFGITVTLGDRSSFVRDLTQDLEDIVDIPATRIAVLFVSTPSSSG